MTDPQWSARSRPVPRPVRRQRVRLGVGLALAGHLATVLAAVIAILATTDHRSDQLTAAAHGLFALLIGQAVVFLGCLVVGGMLAVRQDGGVGIGLLAGWAIGLLVTPVVGAGAVLLAFDLKVPY